MMFVAMIFLAAGAWLYLDCLNKQEKGGAELVHQSVLQLQAEAKKRAEIKSTFETQLATTQNNCISAAVKANANYMALVEQTAPRKRGQVLIPQTVTDESEKILLAAKAECK